MNDRRPPPQAADGLTLAGERSSRARPATLPGSVAAVRLAVGGAPEPLIGRSAVAPFTRCHAIAGRPSSLSPGAEAAHRDAAGAPSGALVPTHASTTFDLFPALGRALHASRERLTGIEPGRVDDGRCCLVLISPGQRPISPILRAERCCAVLPCGHHSVTTL